MKLSKTFTTVTPFSKTIALSMFIIFPICGFFLGMNYQQLLDMTKPQRTIIEYKILQTTVSPIAPEEGAITCRNNNDCPSNYSCVQAGPIMLDPKSKKSLPHLTCWKKGEAIPF